ncbi:hypothetical protein CHLNCDRAFT_144859 [Chlorella variabilis]|uniref:GMP synthase [glutamine-hydrolyzing] n=1 Tax=Chlorella variabilis TaxID=554065 RepID=E1ZD62_CHLVA|nr:hypothetical protein CHLNCDRAFT_144859 [Chlorella variabilis]EFN56364.1 hypothetical protein CHLNCDRAFT_144859 [Chlorella variabilis]|eukprot:XP_005848466.1 hypothetical protein CHLNCDRAFT_144859 [Chlorella variabilis]
MSAPSPAKRVRGEDGQSIFTRHAVCCVLDYGSQYTQLIARRIRDSGVLSVLMPGDVTMERIKGAQPKTIILSGGPNSVHVEGAPRVPDGFWEYCAENDIPVLGICYGMQLIVHQLGGEVKTADGGGEYGRMPMNVVRDSTLFSTEEQDSQLVWMSHGDEAVKLPDGFSVVARSEQGAIVAIEHPKRRIFGLQYHPEVVHSERGAETIRHFLFDIAKMTGDWRMEDVLEEEMEKIRLQVGPTDHVICALSGGVDSTVAATLVLGDRLHCVFVDNGLLRYKEAERVMDTFNQHLHLPVCKVDDADRMLGRLKGLSDPEAKRKAIGAEFIDGTLYPDVIESCPPPGKGQKHSHTIKSHHNVGGLPEDLQFELIEPLRELFKDEVRSLGRLLGVPEQFISRHPFPGPGLAVRIIGDVTEGDRLDVLREVDEVFINSIREWGLYDKIWQAFAVFLPVRSVGVQGDQRTHSHVVALRAVTSSDGMTADWYPFQPDFLRYVSTKICNTVRSVNRVVYDVTSKPPGTIEWE